MLVMLLLYNEHETHMPSQVKSGVTPRGNMKAARSVNHKSLGALQGLAVALHLRVELLLRVHELGHLERRMPVNGFLRCHPALQDREALGASARLALDAAGPSRWGRAAGMHAAAPAAF